ncbi:hypothetical protein [Jannaschia sp. LMIT008]|uniref:hypothetical protein n=1 Tax=Jannaschia maritima TaxID=3032585 RepID=UPI0028109F40|nr:hypothetical protein [Jannaschia sp. LMIT008]
MILARAHATSLGVLGLWHLSVPLAVLHMADRLSPEHPRLLLGVAPIVAAGVPMLALALVRSHMPFDRLSYLVRAIALALIGGATVAAGSAVWSALASVLGILAAAIFVPGGATLAIAAGLLLAQPDDRRGGGRPLIPDLGVALRIYVVADWVLLRLFGLALIGTGWMLYLSGGRNVEGLRDLTWGHDWPEAAVAYAFAGMVLLLPVMLPQALMHPRNVVLGALKAAILAGLTFVFLPALHFAAAHLMEEPWRTLALGHGPVALKTLAGYAVVSTVVVAFFRQLAGSPALDGQGRPIVRLDPEELRALRSARMDG